MYTKEQLEQYEYFKGLDMEYVLDALTGCVSRGYILGLTKYLIEKKEPFAFAIIDLDNFKLINDNYGHKVGDECLNKIIDSFINYIGNNGIVGRYGGDEFIVVYLNDNPTYDNVHAFFTDIYHAKQCVRKSYDLGDIRLFVTQQQVLPHIHMMQLHLMIYSKRLTRPYIEVNQRVEIVILFMLMRSIGILMFIERIHHICQICLQH